MGGWEEEGGRCVDCSCLGLVQHIHVNDLKREGGVAVWVGGWVV